jgi:hypothetical protein
LWIRRWFPAVDALRHSCSAVWMPACENGLGSANSKEARSKVQGKHPIQAFSSSHPCRALTRCKMWLYPLECVRPWRKQELWSLCHQSIFPGRSAAVSHSSSIIGGGVLVKTTTPSFSSCSCGRRNRQAELERQREFEPADSRGKFKIPQFLSRVRV